MMKHLRAVLGIHEPPTPPAAPATQMVPVIKPSQGMPVQSGPSMGFLDRHGDRGPMSPLLDYGPPLRTTDDDVRAAWGRVSANVRHIVQNSGWMSGAVDQATAYIVGSGLSPQIEPEADLLGWKPAFAKTWARRVEKLFADWSNDPLSCDDRGQWTLGQLQAAAIRGWFATGDVLVAVTYREDRPSDYKTGLFVIDPVRVSTPPLYASNNRSQTFYDGIELDAGGRAVAYWLRPLPGGDPKGTRIPVFGPRGRQQVVHSFIGEAGQVRGISPFAPVVEAIKQTTSLGDAMVLAAHAAASVIGVVTSDLPSDAVARSIGGEGNDVLASIMARRTDWHEALKNSKANVTLGPNGRVFHLSSGERFDMHAAREHYQHFPEHMKTLLREISRASGLPYEMFASDRSDATYSSGRLALNDFWSIVEMRRNSLVVPMSNVALYAFVEEAISRRLVAYPGGLEAFRVQKTLALRCKWSGVGKPSADELKAVRAAVMRLENGLTSLADETAAAGSDWEATVRQRVEEEALLLELNHSLPYTSISQRARLSKKRSGK